MRNFYMNELVGYEHNRTSSDCMPTVVRNVYKHFGVNHHLSAQELLELGYRPCYGTSSKCKSILGSLVIELKTLHIQSRVVFFKDAAALKSGIEKGIGKGHMFVNFVFTKNSGHVYSVVGVNGDRVITANRGGYIKKRPNYKRSVAGEVVDRTWEHGTKLISNVHIRRIFGKGAYMSTIEISFEKLCGELLYKNYGLLRKGYHGIVEVIGIDKKGVKNRPYKEIDGLRDRLKECVSKNKIKIEIDAKINKEVDEKIKELSLMSDTDLKRLLSEKNEETLAMVKTSPRVYIQSI